MTLRAAGRLSAGLMVLGIVAAGFAASQVSPSIRILTPGQGFVSATALPVVVEFDASASAGKKAPGTTGNVRAVVLRLNGTEVGRFENRANVKSGRHTFDVDISSLPEGTATLEAFAFQAAAVAGHAGRSERVTIVIDRDLGDGATVGPAGGLLETADGGLRLEVPSGALSTAKSITATGINPAGVPRPNGAGPATTAFRLEPDGLQFARPVRAAVRSAARATQLDGSVANSLSLLASVSGGVVEVLPSQELSARANTGETTISGPITHFSTLGDYPIAPGVSVRVLGLPNAGIPVGDTFAPTVMVFDTAESTVRADDVHFEDDSEAPIVLEGPALRTIPGSLDAGEADELRLRVNTYSCAERGVGAFVGSIDLKFFAGFNVDYSYTVTMTIACFFPSEAATGSSAESRVSFSVDPIEVSQTVDLTFDLVLREQGYLANFNRPMVRIHDLIQVPQRIISAPRLKESGGIPTSEVEESRDVAGLYHQFSLLETSGEAFQRIEYTCLKVGRTTLAITLLSDRWPGTSGFARTMAPTVLVSVECTRPKVGALMGPAGGSISNAMFTLTVPAGALGTTENVAVSVLEPEDLPPALAGTATCGAWQLSPAGLEFDLPVGIRVQLDDQPRQQGGLLGPGVVLFSHVAGSNEALDHLEVDADGEANTTIASGNLMRLSYVVCDSSLLSAAVGGLPDTAQVGLPFAVEVSGGRMPMSTATARASYTDASALPLAFLGDDGGFGDIDGTALVSTEQRYVCAGPGVARFGGDVTFEDVVIPLEGMRPFDVRVRMSTTVQCSGTAAVPPVASFTHTCVNLACSFDGSASLDPDGTIAVYSWSTGDGAGGSVPAFTHTYAAAGTYVVSLTVQDNSGLTHTATTPVTVTAAPPPGGEGAIFHLTRGGGPFLNSAVFSVRHDSSAGTMTMLPPQVPFSGQQPGPMDGDGSILAIGDQGDHTLTNTSAVHFFVRNASGAWVSDGIVPLDGNFVRDLSFDPMRHFLFVSYSRAAFGGITEHLTTINVATKTRGAPLAPGVAQNRLRANSDATLPFVYALGPSLLTTWRYSSSGGLTPQATWPLESGNDLAFANQMIHVGTNLGEQHAIRLASGLPVSSHFIGIGNTGLFGQAVHRAAPPGQVCVYSVSGGGELRVFSVDDATPFVQLVATILPGMNELFTLPVTHPVLPFVYVNGDNTVPLPPPAPPVPSPFIAVHQINGSTCGVTRGVTATLLPPPGPPTDILALPQ